MPPLVSPARIKAVQDQADAYADDIINFLRDICAIPSMDSQIHEVCERVGQEMRRIGFDEVRFDRMGNILGRIGSGPKKILYDSHLDTVGVGDPKAWEWDPFQGKIENGVLFARGACDGKGCTAGMVYGVALAKDLGLIDGWTVYCFGNIEEWCEGIAPNVLVEVEGIRPDFVVIGEPTNLQVYRGQKGRIEVKVIAKGRSAHAASNWLGDNAIYKMLPLIEGIRNLDPYLKSDDFLGKGTISVTHIESRTPSVNAVPDECTIYVDRRLTFGESKEEALSQIWSLIPPEGRGAVTVEMVRYDEPSYTGFRFPVDKSFPAWALEEQHPLVQAGLATYQALWGTPPPTGKWDFSTNGTYWMGKARIPSIGFGPGDPALAHTALDQVRLDDVVRATAWYALLPACVIS